MGYPVYTVPAGDTLPILFDTFDGGTGASITLTGLAVTDIEIYKDGGTTQRASDAGYTLLDTDGIDFDSITGIHGFSIDTSDNTDSGFYTTGSWFHVVVSSVTIDSQTVSFVAAAFRIVAAEAQAGYPLVDVGAISGDTSAADNLEAATDGTGYDIGGIDVSELNTAVDAIGSDGSGLTEAGGDGDHLTEAGGTGDHLNAIPWNSAWDAEVESEANDALVALKLDHLVAVAESDEPADNSIIAKLAASDGDWSGFDNSTDSLEALADSGGGGPTAAQIADAVWDEDATGHQTGGTFGQAIGDPGANTETMYDAVVTDAAGTNVAADIIALDAVADAILVDTAEIGAAGAGLTEAGGDGDHLTEAGGTGDQLTALATSAALATVDSNVDAILVDTGTTLPATLGSPADTDLATDIANVSTQVTTVDGIVDDLKLGVILGSAATGTLTTTVFTTDLTGYADDQLIGRVVIFTSGDADGEATTITDYASSGGTLTVDPALTTAPADSDTFKIV